MGEIAKTTGRTAEPAAAPGTAVATVMHTPAEIARETYRHTLEAKKSYAATLANSGLLPKAYVRQPANVLFALEYGETLGITPIAAMMGIHVIEGRPCASSGLISGLVRKAGHKLRVSGDEKAATCTIIRSDDPEYRFTFTWTMERARQANLTGKQVWKNYPAAMLMARAITEAARAACQDVLYGLGYTPEELGYDGLDDELNGGEVTLATTLPEGELPVTGEKMAELDQHLTRLGVTERSDKLDVSALLADRDRGSLNAADDLTAEEADFIITELEGCEDEEALKVLIAERSELP
jgi:hypothetical protein